MGNAKSKEMGYYGAMSGEGISYEENPDGFLVVKVTSIPPSLETIVEEEESSGRRSPFESDLSDAARRTADLEGSIDSGYVETQTNRTRSRETSPEPIPDRHSGDENDQTEVVEKSLGLIETDCRTAHSLGNHHAYFGYRFYHYNDVGCEGNKHILDDDL